MTRASGSFGSSGSDASTHEENLEWQREE